ncbi:MAG: hypothetical protein ACJ79S_05870 [Gemmatimonadaceae bacterium]
MSERREHETGPERRERPHGRLLNNLLRHLRVHGGGGRGVAYVDVASPGTDPLRVSPEAQQLIAAAIRADVARRLGGVCRHLPPERFEELVAAIANVKLKYGLGRAEFERLRLATIAQGAPAQGAPAQGAEVRLTGADVAALAALDRAEGAAEGDGPGLRASRGD